MTSIVLFVTIDFYKMGPTFLIPLLKILKQLRLSPLLNYNQINVTVSFKERKEQKKSKQGWQPFKTESDTGRNDTLYYKNKCQVT